jgi:hypothetical protein
VSESSKAQRDQELIDQLEPEMARMLFPEQFPAALRVSLKHPALDPALAAAAAAALEHAASRETPDDGPWTTTFALAEVEALHSLFALVDSTFGAAAVEVKINDKILPMARELWLPLFWSLRS